MDARGQVYFAPDVSDEDEDRLREAERRYWEAKQADLARRISEELKQRELEAERARMADEGGTGNGT
jgi:hypothetical protein